MAGIPLWCYQLINTTLSNQMSRKQENSVLRSISLTKNSYAK